MKRRIYIRQAEGGEDSRLFCDDLAKAYVRLAERQSWKVG
jgi:protein subunit release factor A